MNPTKKKKYTLINHTNLRNEQSKNVMIETV